MSQKRKCGSKFKLVNAVISVLVEVFEKDINLMVFGIHELLEVFSAESKRTLCEFKSFPNRQIKTKNEMLTSVY